jgi:hypothetical protein
MSVDEAAGLEACATGFMSAATIEFILDWMEALDGDGQDVLFGNLASNLVLQKRHAAVPFVMTGLRAFPVDSLSNGQAKAIGKWVPFEQYVRSIAPRLLALERTEPAPKTMSVVIHTWGIAERSLSEFMIEPH